MSLFRRGDRYVIEVPTPDWGRGRLYKTLPAGVSKAQAGAIHEMVRTLVAMRAWDVLQAIKDDAYPITQARIDFDPDHPGLIQEAWDRYRRRTSADRIDSDEVLDAWLESLDTDTKQSTKRAYRGHVNRFFKWVRGRKGPGSGVLPEDFSAENVKGFQSHLMGKYTADDWHGTKERKARGATANRYQSSLRNLGSYLVKEGVLERNPASMRVVSRVKEKQNEISAMSRHEWAVVRDALKQVDNINADRHQEEDPYPGLMYFDFLVATGMLAYKEAGRVTPADIRMGDIRPRDMVPVEVPGSKAENRDRDLCIPLSLAERIADHCEKYDIKPNEPLFCYRAKKGRRKGKRVPWKKRRVLKVWHQGMAIARKTMKLMPDYTVFNLRHTYGRFAIEGRPEEGIPGVDVRTLGALMGHKGNLDTTSRYLKYSSDSHEERGAWIAALNAGLAVSGRHLSPEHAAVATVIKGANKARMDPLGYFQAIQATLESK